MSQNNKSKRKSKKKLRNSQPQNSPNSISSDPQFLKLAQR